MRFTNSPYEEIMKQIPKRQQETPPPVFPPEHPCHECPYCKGGPCLGICYRKLHEALAAVG